MIEKVKSFDKKLEQYEYNNILMAKVVRYLMEFIWMPMMMIPIQKFDNEFKSVFSVFFLGGCFSFPAVTMFLNTYINISQGNRETVSIYKVLKYIPVDMQAVFNVRIGYLLHYCKIKLLLYLLFQIISSLIFLKTLSIWNILFPILWVGSACFLPSFFMICFVFFRRK